MRLLDMAKLEMLEARELHPDKHRKGLLAAMEGVQVNLIAERKAVEDAKTLDDLKAADIWSERAADAFRCLHRHLLECESSKNGECTWIPSQR